VSIPRKHHYIPVFYLKRWTGADRRLCEYRRVSGRVAARRTFPNGTGYQKDLYRVENVPEVVAQAMESEFMHMIDTEANYALDKIISGDSTPWSPEMRSAWTRFILSLWFRNPEAVHLLKQHMLALWNATANNVGGIPRPLVERMGSMRAASLLQDVINHDKLGPTIFKMRWSRVVLEASSLALLTSDRPLEIPKGLTLNDAYIALPVGPKTLFVASHDSTCSTRLAAANATTVVKNVNFAVVSQARKFVWGVDDGQRRFVQNQMSRAPDKPILTDEQRQKVINAAVGQ
jgi:hypothetical protein